MLDNYINTKQSCLLHPSKEDTICPRACKSKGLTLKDIHARMLIILEYDAPNVSTLQKEETGDGPTSGRSATTIIEENIDLVYNRVFHDRGLAIGQIVHTISISSESVSNILHNELNTTKLPI